MSGGEHGAVTEGIRRRSSCPQRLWPRPATGSSSSAIAFWPHTLDGVAPHCKTVRNEANLGPHCKMVRNKANLGSHCRTMKQRKSSSTLQDNKTKPLKCHYSITLGLLSLDVTLSRAHYKCTVSLLLGMLNLDI